jgi:hypothetical protein
MNTALGDEEASVRKEVFSNPLHRSHHLDVGLSDESPEVRTAAISSHQLEDHHVNEIVDHETHPDVIDRGMVSTYSKFYTGLQAHHLDKLADRSSSGRD